MNTTFKKLVAGALVAATLVGTVAVSTESASAQGWRYRRGGWGGPLAAGIIGGLALGLALSYVSGYEGSALEPLAALVILMVVLMIRPGGLFSASKERRV